MKKIILILTFIIISLFSFGQNIIKETTDQFDNIVTIENTIERTNFILCGKTATLSVNTGKVGIFSTKYSLYLPTINSRTNKWMDWEVIQSCLNIDEKNLMKLYSAIKDQKDVKISGAKVFASNKVHNSSTRVVLNLKVNIHINENENKRVVICLSQNSIYDQAPVLDEIWVFSEEDIQPLINVLSKYIK